MDDSDTTLSLVMFSGTDDKLASAAIRTAGAAAMGRKVNVFLQYWALEAFRKDHLRDAHSVAPEAGPEGKGLVRMAMQSGILARVRVLTPLVRLGGACGARPCDPPHPRATADR